MKIGLDLRFITDSEYSRFILELIKGLIIKEPLNSFIIYSNTNLEGFNFNNTSIKKIGIINGSIKEQIKYLQLLNKDNNNLMIFFNYYKPIFYKGEYITFVDTLKDIYYSNFSNYYYKYKFLYLLDNNFKKASKIICFDSNTNNELIEKFNVDEDKIKTISGFFPKVSNDNNLENLNINIRAKHNINNDFFIYSGGEGVEKNYDKLIYAFEKLIKKGHNIDLVILGEMISKNITLRNLVLKLNLQKNIHFIGIIKQSEKIFFYKDSLGAIFPSLYEPFPFRLAEPLYFNTAIISSDLKNIKNIFGDTITYFSANYISNIYDILENFLEKNNKKIDYVNIKEKYNKEQSIKQLVEIIK